MCIWRVIAAISGAGLAASENPAYACKTGSLKGVQALAGYVQSRSGKQWIVVFLIGHPNAGAGQQAQDKLVEWIQSKH